MLVEFLFFVGVSIVMLVGIIIMLAVVNTLLEGGHDD